MLNVVLNFVYIFIYNMYEHNYKDLTTMRLECK